MLPAFVLTGVAVVLVTIAFFVIVSRKSKRKASSSAGRFDVAELARRLDVSEAELRAVTPEYREAEIPKRSGGVRRLEIPDDTTKLLQRRINRRLLRRLEAHPLACGFEEGTSIVDAALPHVCRQIVVRIDIQDFFESTTVSRIQQYFLDIGWQTEAAKLLTHLTTHNGHLPQGAPTSPRLSNLVNAPLDALMLRLAKKHSGAYTRYADDITLSFDVVNGRHVRDIIQQARKKLKYFGYTMHRGQKLKIRRQHQQQSVLGLVVNAKVDLPRKTRRWLRSVRHRMTSGQQATLTEEQLRGWESLVSMIERQRDE